MIDVSSFSKGLLYFSRVCVTKFTYERDVCQCKVNCEVVTGTLNKYDFQLKQYEIGEQNVQF